MTTPKINTSFEITLLLLLALLWGSSYLFIRIALEDIPPVTLIAFRVVIASLFLFTVMCFKGESLPREVLTWRRLLVQAFFNSIGAWTLLAWGQQYVDSSLASVLNSTAPIFVFFLTVFITRHEPATVPKLIGACFGVLGVTLIVGVDSLAGFGQELAAQVAILLGAVLYACAAVYGKKFTHLSPIVTATGTMIWASILLVPASIIIEGPWKLNFSYSAILAIGVLGVICTGVALLIYFRLVRTLGSMGVASQSYLRAGVGVVLGLVILDEQITYLVGIGLIAAVIGVAMINTPQGKKRISNKLGVSGPGEKRISS